MLDPRRLRTDLDALKAAVARRGVDTADLDRAAALDALQRERARERDDVRARIKALSKQVGEARRGGDAATAERLSAESRSLGGDEKRLDGEAEAAARELREVLLLVPNPPAPECPDGSSEADNVVVRVVGGDREYGEHQRVPHWEVGAGLGILDLERAAKLSGSMFPMYRGAGATMLRALTQLALDRHLDAFEEIRPPTLVRSDTLTATGHLPKFADDAYHLERDDLWAIPTSEVPLTSLARDEILDAAELPKRMTAYSACFRRESGSAGRDTRGLLRVHEFDKVELVAYCTPEQAPDVHADFVRRAESILGELGVAYRVVELCTGDIGFAAARCFDIDVYAPGCDMWLECASVSWCTDFQARRANIRYRPADGGGTAFVHTLNGSALAWGRLWAAIVEANRRPDGSVAVPEALQPWMRGQTVIR